jgi:hypothetical protein
MPLKLGRLTRHDDQKLVDKVAGKLPRWKGSLLTKTGRLTLVNSVLPSTVIYHMTTFQLSKWAIKQIDKICRNFLWTGSKDARGGNCMMNWKRVQRPKLMGGLGILDLTKFNRALPLRWPWYKWNNCSKPWSDMIIDMNTVEAALFEACTTLVLGDGKSMSFWNG